MSLLQKEEWRLCADWLVRCGAVSPYHHVNLPRAEIFDLVQLLRDGVVLCQLLNLLCKDSVRQADFSERPQMSQLLCLKNICTFLKICVSRFHMRESEVFRPHDLYFAEDFKAVIRTLSRLSQTDLAMRTGISPLLPNNRSLIDHEYYNTLEELQLQHSAEGSIHFYASNDANDLTKEEKVYDDIMTVRRGSLATSSVRTKREHTIEEIYQTEENYVDALNTVVEVYARPLSGLLPTKDAKFLFGNIEELAKRHAAFCKELRTAATVGTPHVSDVFIKWTKQLLIYGEFCSNLSMMLEKLDSFVKTNTHFALQLQECESSNQAGRFGLKDMLTVPFQRMLKYPVLLEALLSRTPKTHEEHTKLLTAVDCVKDLSLYVNEAKRDTEMLRTIAEVERSVVDLKMPPGRELRHYGRLLKDGEVKGLRSAERYNFKDALSVLEYKLENIPSGNRSARAKWAHSFSLLPVEGVTGDAPKYVVTCKTQQDKQQWMDGFAVATSNVRPQGFNHLGHRFKGVTFKSSESDDCAVCQRLLRGLLYQGYQCHECGLIAHKECLTKSTRCRSTISLGRSGSMPGVPSRPVPAPPIRRDRAPSVPLPVPITPRVPPTPQTRVSGHPATIPEDAGGDFFTPVPPTANGHVDGSRLNAADLLQPSSSPSGSEPLGSADRKASLSPEELANYPWWAGTATRQEAQEMLEPFPTGTFLVRASDNPNRRGEYSISFKYGGATMHIKIERLRHLYCLIEEQTFESVPELITYFQHENLKWYFPDINTSLTVPYKLRQQEFLNAAALQDGRKTDSSTGQPQRILGYCIPQRDYSPNTPYQLELRVTDVITITEKPCGEQGWWKGYCRGRSGYFLSMYVAELKDVVDA